MMRIKENFLLATQNGARRPVPGFGAQPGGKSGGEGGGRLGSVFVLNFLSNHIYLLL